MKKLLIVVLICLVGGLTAQPFLYFDNYKYRVDDYFNDMLLTTYSEYEQECYNDSTLIRRQISNTHEITPDEKGILDYSQPFTALAI